MTIKALHSLSIPVLVEKFVEVAVAQDEAILNDDNIKFRRLYGDMLAISDELKSRDGDARSALISLYGHSNGQVRLKAATHTLAVNLKAARRQLESIHASHSLPYALDAGMMLRGLDDGTFRPT